MYSFHKAEQPLVTIWKWSGGNRSTECVTRLCGSVAEVIFVFPAGRFMYFGGGRQITPALCIRSIATRHDISLSFPSGFSQWNISHTSRESRERLKPGLCFMRKRICSSSVEEKSLPQYLVTMYWMVLRVVVDGLYPFSREERGIDLQEVDHYFLHRQSGITVTNGGNWGHIGQESGKLKTSLPPVRNSKDSRNHKNSCGLSPDCE